MRSENVFKNIFFFLFTETIFKSTLIELKYLTKRLPSMLNNRSEFGNRCCLKYAEVIKGRQVTALLKKLSYNLIDLIKKTNSLNLSNSNKLK